MALVYLGIGTNEGNRLDNIKQAILEIKKIGKIIMMSEVYETKPWGYIDQADFLNLCIKLTTDQDPTQLLKTLKSIEKEIGRHETFRWGPRVIDLDILFYNDLVLSNRNLTIPHPRITERSFVIIPLLDIDPEFIHPVFGKSITELSKKLDKIDLEKLDIDLKRLIED